MATFEDLVTEGAAVPVEGWDFSWFQGRATAQRPSWGYAHLMAERMATANLALDLQTGGGEVLAGISKPPPVLVATEGWPPNAALARQRLAPSAVRWSRSMTATTCRSPATRSTWSSAAIW